MVVGELLVAMRNAKFVQPPHEPAGTVEQIELILLAAVDVEGLQPAEIIRLGFDRNASWRPRAAATSARLSFQRRRVRAGPLACPADSTTRSPYRRNDRPRPTRCRSGAARA